MFNLTADTLRRKWPNAKQSVIDGTVKAWPDVAAHFGFNTKLRCAHFWAQISWECGGGTELRENLSYSADRIMQVFGVGHHSAAITRAEAAKLAHNPPALGERAYGLGNPKKARELGNTEAGDGFNFRGFDGLNSTGREAASVIGRGIGQDLVGNPDLCNDPGIALWAGAYEYAVSLKCFAFADADDITRETKRINGGYEGLSGRKALLADWSRIVDANWSDGSEEASSPAEQPTGREALQPFEIKAIQAELAANGFAEVGTPDGKWGNRTTAAISSLQRAAGLPVTGDWDDATRDALAKGIKAPVSDARANATADDLRDAGSKTVAAADKIGVVGKLLKWGGITGGAGEMAQSSGLLDKVNSATQQVNAVKDTFSSVYSTVSDLGALVAGHWWIIAIAAGIGVGYWAEQVIAARLADHQSGANTGR
jgi:putative chitinase